MIASEHSLHSSQREALLEHLFAGSVMRCLWLKGIRQLEFLKPQVDNGGYDLVLEANSIVRYVQMKSAFDGAKRLIRTFGEAGEKVGLATSKTATSHVLQGRSGPLPSVNPHIRTVSGPNHQKCG